MAGARGRDLQTLQLDLDILSAEVADLRMAPPDDLSPALNEARKRIGRLRSDLRTVASDVGRDRTTTVVRMADRLIEPVEDSLGEHPMATIAIGFGAGFIFGLAWRRE
ncbi:Membrane-anchored ribosome-binding protein, inhibits growth in stationary phase, ElaB/YqjD/DUF883 family [Mesorhizobium albiziae]|uniref:Membrane-anchored ribosome-binding protein, inhibits growth in stationary phase, ElaB/YqjD/DUF883 family n=1 Tax=Neomesorhizobium albiziae TaxID=335020 RepID=A0A1I4D1S2_9HYPH|nr:hypothetical protein GCM10007937_01290 [Mesorhizobium albiziae]SFK86116.1 Membrane-anchored ribosome-binding protein, inhibits growth in stationary phase, ElaB/YqjD/DUF883 family [Mesorhizobium albiziae]